MPAATGSEEFDLSNYPEVIDINVFEQILEMDDDPQDRDFSKNIVMDFFTQTEDTLTRMKDVYGGRNGNEEKLGNLSSLGHFLKGSSATLGLVKLQKSCEKVQNFGKGMDAAGNTEEPDDQVSLQNCKGAMDDAEAEFQEAKQLLDKFFNFDS